MDRKLLISRARSTQSNEDLLLNGVLTSNQGLDHVKLIKKTYIIDTHLYLSKRAEWQQATKLVDINYLI